ncbi:uncharacterized protein Z518_06957 [Rhinocladiella mackenziei CBS 650.93]|uniref:Inhibitor of apoptosis repeat-containing protein n=1 Tax=Rhinocladiella mackenziei CBS 650.93 TaxID=1442369 RepID=A0A0D2J367_9EURO|nr:uncharacterized protein Z518_06957 [Rhinocladiella mackenziei CBS 650.93]KIX03405.1 hypothetical protein Z518_06957 [Rhinocladiella mackenziei CBS 650.93]
MEFSTLEARLATFGPPSKRSKLGWPHKTPTPQDLAKAGFYYKPSSTSNDNTICYLCGRSLDGWETDDDPVEEHLKHSSDCGWAILMSAEQDGNLDTNTMEDPTGPQFADARRATFSIGWPHESKRGWTCKTEKMVEAGWHYAPTQESDDFVSCVHCKLSLDGWEPKDNPFDEHYRRSPNCPFFHFAGTTPPSKRPKAKKGRASKVSRASKASTRLSSQSHTTTLSEAPSVNDIPDLDESIDTSATSVMSTVSTTSTTTTKGKRKGTGGKKQTTKSKRARTTRSTRAKKGEPEPKTAEEEEISAEISAEQLPAQTEQAVRSEHRALPSPELSPNAEVAYPTISNSPGVSNVIGRLSPLGAPPQSSPTPVKTNPPAFATQSTATPQPSSKSQDHRSPAPTSSSPSSDIENAPPSTRPASARPPPHKQAVSDAFSPGDPIPLWTPSEVELIFRPTTPQPADLLALTGGTLSTEEKSMTVPEWIKFVAEQAEVSLRAEAERVVGIFEREGQRAMGVLEEIVCV